MAEPIPPDPTTGTWRLKQIGLAKLLHSLAMSDKTGTLVLKRGEVSKSIFFKEGYVMFAESNLATDRLGEVLCRRGEITRAQLSECLAEAKRSGKMLGAVLVEKQVLRAERLLPAIEVQVREIVLGAFAWDDGDYLFSKEFFGNSEDLLDLKIRTSDLVMEGVRRTYSAAQATRIIGNTQLPPKLAVDSAYLSQDLTVNFEISKVLSKIDGKRTIAQIVQETALTELAVLQIMAALAHLKILDVDGSAAATAPSAPQAPGPQDLRVKAARVEEMRAHDEVTQLLDRLPPLVSSLCYDASAATREKLSAAGAGAEQVAQSFGSGRRILDVLQERNYTLELVRAVSLLYGAGVLRQVNAVTTATPSASWTTAAPTAPTPTPNTWQVPKPADGVKPSMGAPLGGGMPVGGAPVGFPSRPTIPPISPPPAPPLTSASAAAASAAAAAAGGADLPAVKQQPISPPPWTGLKPPVPSTPSPAAPPTPPAAMPSPLPAPPPPLTAGFPATKADPFPKPDAGFPATKAPPAPNFPPRPPMPLGADAPIPMPPGPAVNPAPFGAPAPAIPPKSPSPFAPLPSAAPPTSTAANTGWGAPPPPKPAAGQWGAPTVAPPPPPGPPPRPPVATATSSPPPPIFKSPPPPSSAPPSPWGGPQAPTAPPSSSTAWNAPKSPKTDAAASWGQPQPAVVEINGADLSPVDDIALGKPLPPEPIPSAPKSRRGVAFAVGGIVIVALGGTAAYLNGLIPGLGAASPAPTHTHVVVNTPVAAPSGAGSVLVAEASPAPSLAASPAGSPASTATAAAAVTAAATAAVTATPAPSPKISVAQTPVSTATPAPSSTVVALGTHPPATPPPTPAPTRKAEDPVAKARKLASQAGAELNKDTPDTAKAANWARQAIAADPRNPDGYYWLGTAQMLLTDTANAKKNYQKFLQLAGPSDNRFEATKALVDGL